MLNVIQAFYRSPIADIATDDAAALERKLQAATGAFKDRGRHDPAFLPAGAIAYQRDLPDAEVHLLDAGHFARETHHQEIAVLIGDFLGRSMSGKKKETME